MYFNIKKLRNTMKNIMPLFNFIFSVVLFKFILSKYLQWKTIISEGTWTVVTKAVAM